MPEYKVIAYRHVRNHDCIYRRIGDTSQFSWNDFVREEAGIDYAMHVDGKFDVYELEFPGELELQLNEVTLPTNQVYKLVEGESSRRIFRLSGIAK